jgi:hypothetical protein
VGSGKQTEGYEHQQSQHKPLKKEPVQFMRHNLFHENRNHISREKDEEENVRQNPGDT